MTDERERAGGPEPAGTPGTWFAKNLRITAFPAPEEAARPASWWRELTGEDPEFSESRPKTRELAQEGPFERGKLILRVQPDRLQRIFRLIPWPT